MESYIPNHRKDKVIFVMGATGTGKSRLSIDLAAHFNGEIINSDKIQLYQGLPILTNKVTNNEQRSIPHHLIDILHPDSRFTASDFRRLASNSVTSIVARGKLPIIAGGSNSYIEALVDDEFRSTYDCLFLWVDVELSVLHSFVCDRVDRMVELGLVEEVRSMYKKEEEEFSHGIRRAIGVPEIDRYLRAKEEGRDDVGLLEEAIDEIKLNTRRLVCCQLEKIHRLRTVCGWDMYRIDATEVFGKESEGDEAWERVVVGPSSSMVGKFLSGFEMMKMKKSSAARTGAAPLSLKA